MDPFVRIVVITLSKIAEKTEKIYLRLGKYLENKSSDGVSLAQIMVPIRQFVAPLILEL